MKFLKLPQLATLTPRTLIVAVAVGLIAWTALTVAVATSYARDYANDAFWDASNDISDVIHRNEALENRISELENDVSDLKRQLSEVEYTLRLR
ncbi:MAG TPA: hypothetical protein VI485_30080 [Vicinamibacterales bacterium]|nr:hypothetical protein [Vicinamibacterales bacterium]